MKTSFVKMQGLGNDFIVFDGRLAPVPLTPAGIRQICDRRLGVGADMVIVLQKARNVPDAIVFMSIYNFDGSEVAACGNASRCVAGLLLAETGGDHVVLETLAGRLVAKKAAKGQISVDMGLAYLEWEKIPLSSEIKTDFIELSIGGLPPAVAVNIGNPHAVFFVDDAEKIDLAHLGAQVENHPFFPERTNVEFVQVLGPHQLRMRVWERGVGVTPACGSGACAAVVAAVRRGLIQGRQAMVSLDGGDLDIHWQQGNGHVIMTGSWEEVYQGKIDRLI